jgi:hypothetical protein
MSDEAEKHLQEQIKGYLERRGWYVIETHGNMYQRGVPDLICSHTKYGVRLVEVKKPKGYCFTPAQLESFPKLKFVWIMVAPTEEEYKKLFQGPNWYFYLFILNQRGCKP